jgi:hypothetical protein
VGNNGETLVADSSATTGLSYQANWAAGKNKFINGDLAVNQRNFTSTTTSSTYGFDRFSYIYGDGTATYSAQTFTAGTAPVAGYEAANFARIATASQTGVGAYTILQNRIENVRTLAGQSVTLSFWAKAGSGTPKIALELEQFFGTGGSPSGTTQNYFGQVTLSTSWVRYSISFTIPSLSGKTVGTAANTSHLIWNFWTSAGSSFNSRTGSLGIQNSTIDFWGFQLEAGSVATAFQTSTGTIQGELAACQRYFQSYGGDGTYEPVPGLGNSFSTTTHFFIMNYIQKMRTKPTLSVSANGDWSVVRLGTVAVTCTNVALTNTNELGTNAATLVLTTASNASLGSDHPIALLALNTSNARLNLSAEL